LNSSVVIDHVKNRFPSNVVGVAYFYFDYKDQEGQRPSSVVAGLVKQLLCCLEIWPPEIEETYTSSLKTDSDPDYDTLLDALISVSRRFTAVYILIDAFDEVDSEHQPTFLSLVQRISQNSIKTLVTCRPHLEICREFETSGLRITISADDTDIKEYLSIRLNKRKQLASGLKTKIIETLSTQADGMYQTYFCEAKLQVSVGRISAELCTGKN